MQDRERRLQVVPPLHLPALVAPVFAAGASDNIHDNIPNILVYF